MLPRTTGLVCPGFTGALPTMNPMRVETIVGLPRDYSAFYLIQPDTTPFAYRQFRYFMNAEYTGELFLSADHKCQFRSALQDHENVDHGRWFYCKYIEGVVCQFDYANRPQLAKNKWTFFRGMEGIDYRMRQIYVIPVADWVWNRLTFELDRHGQEHNWVARAPRPTPELTFWTEESLRSRSVFRSS